MSWLLRRRWQRLSRRRRGAQPVHGEKVEVQRFGKQLDGLDIRQGFAALPAGDGGAGYIHRLRQLLLGEAAFLADGAELPGKCMHERPLVSLA